MTQDGLADNVVIEYGVAFHATARPEKVAIVFGDRRITYGELDHEINRAARFLADKKVGPGCRLGIALRNRPEWIIAAFAAARLGAQVVPIPYGTTPDELDYFCTDGEVEYLLNEAGLDSFIAEASTRSGDALPEAAPDYIALRAYTSGTTGVPKAVLRPEVAPHLSIQGLVGYYTAYGLDGPDEVNVTGSPMYHIAGFSGPHTALLLGHTTVILDHFDAGEWLQAIETERVTYAITAPVHLYRVMQLSDDVRAAADVSSIKRIMHGSAPCAPSLKRQVIDFFPVGAVWEAYGGTETMGTIISSEEWLTHPGSVGRPAPGSAIAIMDDEGNELPTGDVGLVYIGSEWGLGFRYAGPAEHTEAVYRGDLATLGDLGYVNDDGYLFIVDRRKDMVITGGANVYPAEVEAVLVEHPNIDEVAVIGMPDDEYGEIVTAVVVAHGELNSEEVIAFAREHLVAYKSPRRVEFVDVLPRDQMGKVLKRVLRELGTFEAL